MVVEIVAGIRFGSMALLADGLDTISGFTDTLRALLHGATLVPIAARGVAPSELVERLRRARPTLVHLVPTVFRRLLRHGGAEALATCRWLHLGARWYLALQLFGYGTAKFYGFTQFPEPSII